MNTSRLASRLIGALSFLTLIACHTNAIAARFVDLTVVNRSTGERLTPYRHEGRLYVAGTPGERYAIELRSVRGERVMTVLSVDGVNVLTGQTAATLQSGYVLDGWQSFAVTGWRKSMDDVAQFVFTDLPQSYAARTGRPGNVGVIGVAVFREKIVLPPPPAPLAVAPQMSRREDNAAEAPAEHLMKEASQSMPAPAPEAKAERSASAAGSLADLSAARAKPAAEAEKKIRQLGTGHGEREYSPTRTVDFVRNSNSPDEVITIYYDSRPNLVARGIIPVPRIAEPQPFPAGFGFVPDPRG